VKALARLFAGLCFAILLYLMAAVVGAFVPGRVVDMQGGSETTVILAAGPIHYDLLFPADPETLQAFGFLGDVGVPMHDPDWIIVGWGSRAFYTATGTYQDMALAPVGKAVVGDSAVLRFDVAYGDLNDFGLAVPMSYAQLAMLRGQILQELARDEQGALVPVAGAGFTATDVFLAANSRFSILRTCNVWIGDVLRGAGVKMGIWTPTPYAVTLSRWWFG
jgi:uncharacterized protein (TIGR02117 family)